MALEPVIGSVTANPGGLAGLLAEHPLPDSAALISTVSRTMTAGEVRRRAADIAQRLGSRGHQSGQAVVIRLPNGPEFISTMFGVWMTGGVLVPANPRQPTAELDHVIEATGPAVVIDEAGLRDAGATPTRYEPDIAFVTWTSGTTGRPRPILHTHSGYLELLDRVLGPLRGRPADPARPPSPNLVPVSLALNAGIYNVLFGLRAGAPLVLMDRFSTSEFATLVRRFSIRSTVLPPAAMVMLADDEQVTDLAPLRYVRSITAPLSPLSARRFTDKFGVTVLNGYGQAEIGEVIGWTAADAREHPDKVGAVGCPHPGVAIKVIDDHGSEASTGTVGELLVKPPSMASGYADGGSLADRIDEGGYVRTGDFARVDDDGFVWIEGRVGDLINRGGNKVFPGQVEEVLCLSPRVSEAAVVGFPDERLGEVPVAFVVGSAPDDELERLCRDHLVPYKIPVAFRRIDALPRSEVGKILRRELLAGAGEATGASGRPPAGSPDPSG
ncbi:MAG TPA: class I adenylate-forming enzyme family protein [Acidimicrobiales bacterium]|nr:class I adenylate-forming enzyme family protein [Acidimicrobiales bacterium]